MGAIGLDLNIDNKYLDGIVKDTVMIAMTEALNGKNEVVDSIIRAILTTKVTEKGTISSYSYDNKYTVLEYHLKKLLEEEVQNQMKAMLEEHREEITNMIRKELTKKVNYNKFVEAFFSSVEGAISNTWCPRINVEFAKDEEKW